ncbi:hypothetical protein Tco_0189842 [Tanacetum coccineum]
MPSWTSSESWVISDDDLPSEYYKELLYGMLQKHKQLKKHGDYEQLINVLAMDKSRLEEELRATKSQLKLYDRCYGSNVNELQMQAAIVSCKCKLQMLACNLQMLATYKCLQMQSANACLQTGTSCKFKLQLQDANACLQPANACLQMQASIV